MKKLGILFFALGSVVHTSIPSYLVTRQHQKGNLGHAQFARTFNLKYLRKNRLHERFEIFGSIHTQDLKSDPKYALLKDYYDKLINRYGRKVAIGDVAPIHIHWYNDAMGYGVFADRSLKKGDFICEYTGVLCGLSDSTAKNRYLFTYPSDFALVKGARDLVIDAEFEGNIARFLNHSYEPNVDVLEIPLEGMWHIVFTAKRDIPRGGQLFINYGKGYWDHLGIKPS